MLQRLREWLTLVLVAALPFHALLVTFGTKLAIGPGSRPLPPLALWKEGVLGLILLLAIVEIIRRGKWKVEGGKLFDAIDWCIGIALLYAIAIAFVPGRDVPIAGIQWLLGFKYDFIPLVAFFILRRVSWSDAFKNVAAKALLIVGSIVAIYGIVTVFLPQSFFTALGYSDLHSLYQSEGALAAFQQIGGTTIRRIQSTMSGPNQLGLYMLLPLAIALGFIEKRKEESGRRKVIAGILIVIALMLSFSRAAWIGAAVMVIVGAKKRKKLVAQLAAVGIVGVIIIISAFPSIFLRVQSNAGHIDRPLAAIQTMLAHPFGLGLGSAGPASNAVSDTCVELSKGADATWAKDRPNLCVFVDGTQVQPAEACNCPKLTENWYLQWGVEMGWIGLFLSLALVFFVLKKWKEEGGKRNVGFAFLGISVAGLFLHSFEDAAVAYTVWVLLASVMKR